MTDHCRPIREQIDRAVGEVLSNAMNHPVPMAVAGRSIAPLRTKVTDAVLALLDTMPTAADAWDEGYISGHSRAMRRMSDEPNVEPGTNPYRKADDE